MVKARPLTTPSDYSRAIVLMNDYYCVPQWGLMTGQRTESFVDNCQILNVNCFVADYIPLLPGITCTYSKECSRKGHKSDISNFLQQTFLDSKTQQQMESNPRPEFTKQISKIRDFQNTDTREHKDFLIEWQINNIHRFQGCLLPYTNKSTVQEIHTFSRSRSIVKIQSSTIWSVHGSSGIHSGSP